MTSMAKISRRGFVKVAATAAVLGTMGGLLSSCGKQEAKSSAKGEHTADFVVVGGGIGGQSAAIRASEMGASVVLLEKLNVLGGDSAISSGTIHAPGTKAQAAQGFDGDAIDIYIEDLRLDAPEFSTPGEPMCHALFEGAAEMVDYLEENGIAFLPIAEPDYRAHNVDGGGGALMKFMKERLEESSAEIYTETPAASLVIDGEKVVGVMAGEELFNATKGVILATGGFANNVELVAKYAPDFSDVRAVSSEGAEGEGLEMGMEVGASTMALESGMHTYFVSTQGMADMSWQCASSSAIIVNKNGERFHAEDCHYDAAGKIGMEQPDCMAYMIFDTAARDKYEIFEDSFASNIVVEGANVDELASTIGASGLADAVAHYNDMAAQGVDGDFGREACVEPLVGPEFYAIEIEPCYYYSYGGLVIDEEARVLSEAGSPIEGLFACGEVCVSSEVREGLLYSSGLSQGYVFGRKAVEAALA
ncbi:FAD-dependent oxidoreductase [Slackia sp.]|uniref:FAD-dependent oxidoreductase n=2 Tax=Slackia TaxID=84108 RepID=UPI00262491B5|nr:FAD-dependent oxidoreductase [Slackia sp.]